MLYERKIFLIRSYEMLWRKPLSTSKIIYSQIFPLLKYNLGLRTGHWHGKALFFSCKFRKRKREEGLTIPYCGRDSGKSRNLTGFDKGLSCFPCRPRGQADPEQKRCGSDKTSRLKKRIPWNSVDTIATDVGPLLNRRSAPYFVCRKHKMQPSRMCWGCMRIPSQQEAGAPVRLVKEGDEQPGICNNIDLTSELWTS